ncbi:uncharacterized protein LOC128669210 [Plodia interpunctella]|uniref:uncharacterized protein LOC128669210 n=1 Tax=Plodia interpunctella TaxID=58824 RepID=UPI002367DBA3|nr:uncharacterized protein LOC128669210 [Plodia interpunctella]
MFKIPNWADDVPKTNIQFGKTNKKKKKNESVSQTDAKDEMQFNKQDVKSYLSTTFMANGNNLSAKTKKKKRKRKGKLSEVTTSSSEFIPGQFVLNPNKRKLDNKSTGNDSKISEIKKKRGMSNRNLANISESKITNTKEVKKETQKKEISQMGIKINSKKEKIKKMLAESNRNSIDGSNSNSLRQRMLDKLKAAQFRYLNEKLYTSSGSEAKQLFQSDPDAFQTYHQGYQQQLKKWPVNPLDLIVKRIMRMPKTHTIADMGCGEAALSKRVPHTVRSFDLVATYPGVEVCDMAHTPLLSESVDVAVYCLALMGTDLAQYLVEANRVLKTGGVLLIAEVESRFEKAETFTDAVQRLGFKLKNLDSSHKVFFFMEFVKVTHAPAKKSKLPAITLKPCLYKKR